MSSIASKKTDDADPDEEAARYLRETTARLCNGYTPPQLRDARSEMAARDIRFPPAVQNDFGDLMQMLERDSMEEFCYPSGKEEKNALCKAAHMLIADAGIRAGDWALVCQTLGTLVTYTGADVLVLEQKTIQASDVSRVVSAFEAMARILQTRPDSAGTQEWASAFLDGEDARAWRSYARSAMSGAFNAGAGSGHSIVRALESIDHIANPRGRQKVIDTNPWYTPD
jgi:hypothetical protein